MSQILTVCRIDAEFAVRDVTGSTYGHSPDIGAVLETAQRMARRIGADVKFTPEAEKHFRDTACINNVESIGTSNHVGAWAKLKRWYGRRVS